MAFFLLFVGLMENEYMKGLIESFSRHLKEAIEIGKQSNFSSAKNEIRNVVVCGLGGSGIGGSIVSKLVENELKVPFTSLKGYHLPKFVDSNSLVICCSYSGNTEETVSLYKQAIEKGAEIAIITSGGKFEEFAKSKGHNHLIIPGGLPPRAAFGLAFPQLLFCLSNYNLISSQFIHDLEKGIASIDAKEAQIQDSAKDLAKFLNGKMPVLYGESRWEGILVRFRQQLNENSKILCWHHVIPEMNHNELVGWKNKDENLAVVFFRSDDDYYRNKERISYNQEVISNYTSNIKEVIAEGDSFLAKSLYLIHLGDWCSYYIAAAKDIDSVEVNVITGLKNMLAGLD
ncbi:MAG: bifunctional phosphoglucose/phosphomannose isomerase [Flavobacteriales bacterium]|nr:bifunctional phosphoglucose/phosphomannose isomerase [Flavobacteriales bacterium]